MLLFKGKATTGATPSTGVQFDRATTRVSCQFVTGKTGTFILQGSLDGVQWTAAATSSTFSTAGLIIGKTLTFPSNRVRVSLSVVGAGTTGVSCWVVPVYPGGPVPPGGRLST